MKKQFKMNTFDHTNPGKNKEIVKIIKDSLKGQTHYECQRILHLVEVDIKSSKDSTLFIPTDMLN